MALDLEKTKRTGILNMSPADEVEGELVYYQHKLLCNAVARKHISGMLLVSVHIGFFVCSLYLRLCSYD